MKVLHSICQQIWKTQQRPQDWKRSVFIPIPKKHDVKERSNYRTIALISHASKVILKILQARLQHYMNWELLDVQPGRKDRETKDQIADIRWLIEKAREFQKKHLLLLHWLCKSLWLCVFMCLEFSWMFPCSLFLLTSFSFFLLFLLWNLNQSDKCLPIFENYHLHKI